MTTRRFPSAGLFGAAVLCMLAACAAVPAPVGEMAEAERAVQAATDADAATLAPIAFDEAQRKLVEAKSALQAGHHVEARQLAEQAAADAAFAEVAARAEQSERAAAMVRGQIQNASGELATQRRAGS